MLVCLAHDQIAAEDLQTQRHQVKVEAAQSSKSPSKLNAVQSVAKKMEMSGQPLVDTSLCLRVMHGCIASQHCLIHQLISVQCQETSGIIHVCAWQPESIHIANCASNSESLPASHAWAEPGEYAAACKPVLLVLQQSQDPVCSS